MPSFVRYHKFIYIDNVPYRLIYMLNWVQINTNSWHYFWNRRRLGLVRVHIRPALLPITDYICSLYFLFYLSNDSDIFLV